MRSGGSCHICARFWKDPGYCGALKQSEGQRSCLGLGVGGKKGTEAKIGLWPFSGDTAVGSWQSNLPRGQHPRGPPPASLRQRCPSHHCPHTTASQRGAALLKDRRGTGHTKHQLSGTGRVCTAAVTSQGPRSIPVPRDLFPLSSRLAVCALGKQDRRAALLRGQQRPFGMGSAPLPGREPEGKRSHRDQGAGEVKDVAELAVVCTRPSLPPQPLAAARPGTAARGRGHLSPSAQSSDPGTHLPGTPAARGPPGPPCLAWQVAPFSCSHAVCRGRKLKGCLSG